METFSTQLIYLLDVTFPLITLCVFFPLFQELVRQVFCALKAISGNDDVKDAVVNAGGVPLIVIAMNRHMGNPHVSTLSRGHIR